MTKTYRVNSQYDINIPGFDQQRLERHHFAIFSSINELEELLA
jgi:hypothetical protein